MSKNKPLCYRDLIALIKTFDLVVIKTDEYFDLHGHTIIIYCSKYLADLISEKSGYELRLTNGDKWFGDYWIDHIVFTGF